MTIRRTFVFSQLRRCGASLLALGLVAITGTVSGEQDKQPSERDAGRIRRSASRSPGTMEPPVRRRRRRSRLPIVITTGVFAAQYGHPV